MERLTRLTREEQRAQTRTRLLDAAEDLFAERGISASSIEEIAEAAGYSRGAFYSNFADKDDLVFAVMARKSARDLAEVAEFFAARTSAADFLAMIRERETSRAERMLGLEFHLYATRNLDARPHLAQHLAASRAQTEAMLAVLWDEAGIDAPVQTEFAARVMQALDDGIGLLRLIDPDAYPRGMYSDVALLLHDLLLNARGDQR